jgi:hypothetical protein
MVKDPVCGMMIDEKTAAATSEYQGQIAAIDLHTLASRGLGTAEARVSGRTGGTGVCAESPVHRRRQTGLLCELTRRARFLVVKCRC